MTMQMQLLECKHLRCLQWDLYLQHSEDAAAPSRGVRGVDVPALIVSVKSPIPVLCSVHVD